MRDRRLIAAACGLLLLAAAADPTAAEPAVHDEVLIVVNRASPLSRAIGTYYRAARNVPLANVVELSIPMQDPSGGDPRDESISRPKFVRLIRTPIARFLEEKKLAERIEVIVTTQGVPLVVAGPHVEPEELLQKQTRAAVDAELALLFSDADGSAGIAGSANPYFRSDEPFAAWRKRHSEAPLRYLVARLAAYHTPLDPGSGVPRDVKRAIDAAQAAAQPGVFLIDEDPRVSRGRDAANVQMLRPAAALLAAQGRTLRHERSPTFASGVDDIVGLASWGSNASATPGPPYWGSLQGRLYPGRFAPRAVAVTLVSSNARSFVNPTRYGQSLVADLLRLGVAGASGHVYEPTLSGVARPNLLLHYYAQGVPAGEAFFRSIPFLSWMNVWIGDPLMRATDGNAPGNAPGNEPGRAPATSADRDGDGTPDPQDNCPWQPNPSQRDSDGDGFGNRCDGDVNGDGLVTTSFGALRPAPGDAELIAIAAHSGRYEPALDLDEDGDVDLLDVSTALLGVFHPPGPRGDE